MGLAAYVTAVLADTPVCFYQCQEASGLLQDSSGNANHMQTSPAGAVTYHASGPMPGAFAIQVPNLDYFTRTGVTGNAIGWTIELWYQPAASTAGNMFGDELPGNNGWMMAVSTNRKMQYFLPPSTGGPEAVAAMTLGTWYYLVITCASGTGATFYYVNGTQDSSLGNISPTAPGSATVFLGAPTGGGLSCCALYTAAISSARVAAHWAAASAGGAASSGGAPALREIL